MSKIRASLSELQRASREVAYHEEQARIETEKRLVAAKAAERLFAHLEPGEVLRDWSNRGYYKTPGGDVVEVKLVTFEDFEERLQGKQDDDPDAEPTSIGAPLPEPEPEPGPSVFAELEPEPETAVA